MTATDELRRLLDERGIEYEPIDSVHSPNRRTLWGKVERGKGIFGMDAKYETIEFKKGMRLTISDCSPEQAVEATLGSDLKAENEQLRRERDFYFQQVTDNGERAHRAIDALNAENAELRELVRDMAAVICVYDQCVTVDDCPPALPMFTDKMRELGIEVDA